MLVLPEECHHISIEREFENPATYEQGEACGDLCSYCNGTYKRISGPLSRERLTAALETHIFNRGTVSAIGLTTFITGNQEMSSLKKQIWGDKAKVTPSNVHGLFLMLFASGILEMVLDNKDLAGKESIKLKNCHVRLSKYIVTSDEIQYEQFTTRDDDLWRNFNLLD